MSKDSDKTDGEGKSPNRMNSDVQFKAIFGVPKTIEQLLRTIVDYAWIEAVDFSSLKDCSEEFEFKGIQRRSDRIWRARFRTDLTADEQQKYGLDSLDGPPVNEVYFYVLAEFQSSNEPRMALRMNVYRAMLEYRHAERNPGELVPDIIPVVVYSGSKRWTAPTDASVFRGPRLTDRTDSYYLLDLDDPHWLSGDSRNLIRLMAEISQSESIERLGQVLGDAQQWLPEHPACTPTFEWLYTNIMARIPAEDRPASEEIVTDNDPGKGITMLLENIEKDRQKIREESEAKGKAEGKAEALQDSVIGVLAARFGRVPDVVSEKLRSNSNIEQLQHLTDAAVVTDSVEAFESKLAEM